MLSIVVALTAPMEQDSAAGLCAMKEFVGGGYGGTTIGLWDLNGKVVQRAALQITQNQSNLSTGLWPSICVPSHRPPASGS